MNWKQCSISVGLGIAVGWTLSKQCENKNLSAEKALSKVKGAVRQNSQIDGSWIHMTPQVSERFGLTYDVYNGGLTLTENEIVKHYDFTVDANTGTVLDMSSTD